MRRVLVTLVLGLFLGGPAACGSGEPPVAAAPPSPLPSASTTRSDPAATAAACTEAITVSRAGGKAFARTLDELYTLALEDIDQSAIDAKRDQMERALRTALAGWSRTLTALAARDVDPRVRAALLDGARAVDKLNDPADLTAPNEARTTLERLAGKIKTACPA